MRHDLFLCSIFLMTLLLGGCAIDFSYRPSPASTSPRGQAPAPSVPSQMVAPLQAPAASIGILVDTSPSMAGNKHTWALEAVRSLVDVLQPQDEAFMMSIQTHPILVQSFTQDRSALDRALNTMQIEKPTVMNFLSIRTALFDAVLLALQ